MPNRNTTTGEIAYIREFITNLSFSIGFALLISLSARMSFELPSTPIPMTLQIAAVLLAGLVLGPRWGLVAVGQYLALGLMGAPVFAGGLSGPGILLNPSFGYLIAFLPAVWITGALSRRYPATFIHGAWISITGVAIIYMIGSYWLGSFVLLNGKTVAEAFSVAWTAGIAPFVTIDIIKTMLVSGIWGVYLQTSSRHELIF
jgi:biotin transport system substrate-specific component